MSGYDDNLPADWGSYYRACTHCGAEYHASAGGCDECADEPDTHPDTHSDPYTTPKEGTHAS